MRSTRLAALVAALAVTAAACGGGSSADSADSTNSADSADSADAATASDPDTTTTAPDSDVAAGSDSEEDPEQPATELFSPTETTEPYDLSGGATSSDEGVTIVVDDPQAGLRTEVNQATEPWPTDWTRQTAELDGFLLGIQTIDPRDRIPPIDVPKFEPIAEATWLGEREPGALVQIDGEARFYPLSILTRHEIVNDRFGDLPVAITFCPLCNTAIAFDARVDGQRIRLGVSGLLRKSDLVMWDDLTTTLWQQITGEAVVGELAGTRLEFYSTSIVSYADALENFPDALSLSQETGFNIAYGANGYRNYSSSTTPFLFDGEVDERFPALSRVVGVSIDEASKAYPFEVIDQELAVNDELGGIPIVVLWGGDTADALDGAVIADSAAIGTGIAFDRRVNDQTLTFTSTGDDMFTDSETGTTWTLLGRAVEGPLAGEQLQTVVHRNEFWFAWTAFFPDAPVYGTA